MTSLRRWIRRPRLGRRGAVGMMFGLTILPMVIAAALAVDFGFYVQAEAQLNLAADTAAMHAARVAEQTYLGGNTDTSAMQAAGVQAGQQWFQAQLGTIASANVPAANVGVAVTITTAPLGISSTVTYSGTVATHLGSFILPSWPVASASTAVIQDTYLELLMMIDNSSSMLIPSSTSDIVRLEQATVCSTQSANEGVPMNNYTWQYTGGHGYPAQAGQNFTPPPVSPQNGHCWTSYNGPASTCFYVPATIALVNGKCSSGGSDGSDGLPVHTPEAPCAFACHNSATNNDYYGLARSLSPAITLRLDVVHSAAASVIQALQADQEMPNQFSVGVYEFNSTLSGVYPGLGAGEAGTNLSTALSDVQQLSPPLSAETPNTYFSNAVASLVSTLTPAGNGTSSSAPLKYIFIVTDGVQDTWTGGAQVITPFTTTTNEQTCQKFKNLGFTVYVLYTPYLPIPTPTYVNQVSSLVTPQSNSLVTQALQACASSASDFFQASSATDINTAMQTMLQNVLNSAGRITQ